MFMYYYRINAILLPYDSYDRRDCSDRCESWVVSGDHHQHWSVRSNIIQETLPQLCLSDGRSLHTLLCRLQWAERRTARRSIKRSAKTSGASQGFICRFSSKGTTSGRQKAWISEKRHGSSASLKYKHGFELEECSSFSSSWQLALYSMWYIDWGGFTSRPSCFERKSASSRSTQSWAATPAKAIDVVLAVNVSAKESRSRSPLCIPARSTKSLMKVIPCHRLSVFRHGNESAQPTLSWSNWVEEAGIVIVASASSCVGGNVWPNWVGWPWYLSMFSFVPSWMPCWPDSKTWRTILPKATSIGSSSSPSKPGDLALPSPLRRILFLDGVATSDTFGLKGSRCSCSCWCWNILRREDWLAGAACGFGFESALSLPLPTASASFLESFTSCAKSLMALCPAKPWPSPSAETFKVASKLTLTKWSFHSVAFECGARYLLKQVAVGTINKSAIYMVHQ